MSVEFKLRPEVAGADLRRLFEDFLFMEARLMDNHKYDEWYQLWTEDALYWLPCNHEDVNPANELSILYENRDQIKERIRRLRSKFAHAQSPKSRLLRILSNIEIQEVTESTISGSSNFVMGDVRMNRQTVWFGRNHHVLRRTPDGMRMQSKKVVMLNNDTPMSNLTFLV